MKDHAVVLAIADNLLEKLGSIPPGISRMLARWAGRLWYRLDHRHRGIAMRNLEQAMGKELDGARREALCEKVFEHLATVAFEVPYLRTLTPSTVDRFVEFSGLEHLWAALAKDKGALILSCHFGNWEMMSLAFSIKFFPFNVIVRPLDNPLLDRLVSGIRGRGGNRMIPKRGSIKQVLRLIHRKEYVALLIDQNVDWYDGVFVPFFGKIACTNKALAVLALRTGAPVIPIFNVRLPDGRYRFFCEPEVPLIRTGDLIGDTEENMANFNRIIERQVRLHPDQWFWVHQRWKTRPYKPWPRGSATLEMPPIQSP